MRTDRWTAWACVATLLLLTGCLLPRHFMPAGERLTPAVPQQDKLVHVGMFAAFGFLWARAGSPGGPSRRRAASVLLAAVILAVGTEWAQGLDLIGRDPDALDALADVAGAVLGVGAVAARSRG